MEQIYGHSAFSDDSHVDAVFWHDGAGGNTANSHDGPGLHQDLVKLELSGRTVIDKFGYEVDTRSPEELIGTWEIDELRRLLAEFRALCTKQDIVPVVVYVPIKAHVYAEHTSSDSGKRWNNRRDVQMAALDNVENTVSAVCRDVGIDVISVTSSFKERAKSDELLYYHFGTHWSSVGRQVAARVVANQILTKYDR